MINLPDAITPIKEEHILDLNKTITSKWYTDRFQKPIKKFGYYSDDKKLIAVSVLFEGGVKEFYYSSQGWISAIPRNLKPINLFNITKLPKDCNNIFIVNTEIEAQKKIPGWHGLSWIGGNSKTLNLANWKKLTNIENILIWTDDQNAKKIKTRIPHSKIITNGSFDKCENPLQVFEEKSKFKNLKIPEPDSYEFYRLFIQEFYGDESLEQRNGIFWKYSELNHHWKQEEYKDIKANFQTWFSEQRKDIGTTLLDFVRAEGLSINKFMNNCIEFIARHAASAIHDNPFKDSAISPYIHINNGMLHLTKKDKMAEWIDRTNKNEDFFRKKFPVHCCDYEFNKENLDNVTIDNAPVFKYVIDSFIPKNIEISEIEKQKTRDFFTQIIAYSISPIKPVEYFFGLYGDERTGKSFFVDILKDIIGDRFFLERPIDEMTQNNRFASSDFWGAKVYVEPDMKTNSVLPEAFIKTFAGQKQITLEKKHNTPERGVNISIAMFFVSNFDFITKGMEGLARRIIYLPFRNSIKNPDSTLRDKIKGEEQKGIESGKFNKEQFDERPVILALAMKGWKDFLKNGCCFTMPEWISNSKNEWIQKSDTVKNFITENYLNKKEWLEINRKDLYSYYSEWCKDERDKKPYGKTRFYEEMGRMPAIKSKKVSGERLFEFFPEKKPQKNLQKLPDFEPPFP